MSRVIVVGAGLAGAEAAWQIAERGVEVTLFEMRPKKMTEAHVSGSFAEMVCSNSLGSDLPNAASRILKDELASLGAFVLAHARECSVPAGGSLAVDRVKFAESITRKLSEHPRITVCHEEFEKISDAAITLICTGPLTSKSLTTELARLTGQENLYFYDAIAPIISTESLRLDEMFYASRYGKGDPDFLNIPLTKEQYEWFVGELLKADVVLPHNFEEEKYFEACMPIEVLASRGPKTLSFGPMKPVGLDDPKTGRRPFAAIQLRAENRFRTAYNMVGFQTKMKYGEQQRILRQLPGLQDAEFLRLGSMHRNTYIHSPQILFPTLQMKKYPHVFVAGQLTGTEGYLESSATGWLAGTNAARLALGEDLLVLPPTTMLGAIVGSITDETRTSFQPLNANFGVLPPLDESFPVIKKDKAKRNEFYSVRSQKTISGWKEGMSA